MNSCLQMIMGFYPPPASTFLYFLGEVLLDYVLAFMALGLAELFARPFKNRTVGVAVGTFAAGFLRFMCSFLSGVLVWGNLSDGLAAWTYSLTYNAAICCPRPCSPWWPLCCCAAWPRRSSTVRHAKA